MSREVQKAKEKKYSPATLTERRACGGSPFSVGSHQKDVVNTSVYQEKTNDYQNYVDGLSFSWYLREAFMETLTGKGKQKGAKNSTVYVYEVSVLSSVRPDGGHGARLLPCMGRLWRGATKTGNWYDVRQFV